MTNKDKILVFVNAVFWGFLNLDINLFGVNLTIILSVALLIMNLLWTDITISKNYSLISFVLFLSILYAVSVDAVLGKEGVLFNLLSKTITLVLCITVVSYYSKLGKKPLFSILEYSCITMSLINFVIILLFIYPPTKGMVSLIDQYGSRLCGFNKNPNGYALNLNFVLFFNLLYLTYKKNTFFGIACLLFTLLSIFLVQSRGLYLSTMFFFTLFLLYQRKRKIIRKQRRRLIKLVFISILLIGGSFFVFQQYIGISSFDLSRFNENNKTNATDFSLDKIDNDRGYLFRAAWETFLMHPFGNGYGDQEKLVGQCTGVYLLPHNTFLTLLLRYGLVFIPFWFALFFYPIIEYTKLRNRINLQIGAFFFAGIISLSVFLCTHSGFTVYIWAFLSMAIGVKDNTFLRNCCD